MTNSGADIPAKAFVDSLNNAIRENPLAAGLVGIGTVWMIFGTGNAVRLGRNLSSLAQATGGSVVSAAAKGTKAVGDAISHAGEHASATLVAMGEKTRDLGEQASGMIAESVRSGADVIQSTPQDFGGLESGPSPDRGFGWELMGPIQSNLTRALEQQPLMLGAIGLALGAGLAAALPRSKIEEELAATTGAAAIKGAQKFASQAAQRARDVVQEAAAEAEAQGLTPSELRKQVVDTAEKVKAVAQTATRAGKQRLP